MAKASIEFQLPRQKMIDNFFISTYRDEIIEYGKQLDALQLHLAMIYNRDMNDDTESGDLLADDVYIVDASLERFATLVVDSQSLDTSNGQSEFVNTVTEAISLPVGLLALGELTITFT